MCDIATIAGFALSAASAGINAAAQAKVQRARDDAMAAERIRQNSLDKEAQALNVQSQDKYKDIQGQQDQKASELGDFFKGQEVAPPPATEAVPQSASNIVVQEQAKQQGKAKEFTDQTGQALGNLRSFGDLMAGLGREQSRNASLIGQVGGFKRGSSGVLSYELDDANRAGDGLKLFGDLLGGAGSIATNYGLSGTGGGGLFGAKAASAKAAGPGSMAVARAADRASVPGYSASPIFTLYGS